MSASGAKNFKSPWRSYRSICGVGVGDRGQRYEVRYKDRDGVEHVMGWAGTPEGAQTMALAIEKHPSWHSPRVVDRHLPKGGLDGISG